MPNIDTALVKSEANLGGLQIVMEYQYESLVEVVNGEHSFTVNVLNLIRNGKAKQVSGDSIDLNDRAFYLAWKKCKHTDELVVVNPPFLCHVFDEIVSEKGIAVATVCASCFRDELDAFPTPQKKHVQSIVYYRVTDLNVLPEDSQVLPDGNDFLVPVGVMSHLPESLRKTLKPVRKSKEAITIRRKKQDKVRQAISVMEAKVLAGLTSPVTID